MNFSLILQVSHSLYVAIEHNENYRNLKDITDNVEILRVTKVGTMLKETILWLIVGFIVNKLLVTGSSLHFEEVIYTEEPVVKHPTSRATRLCGVRCQNNPDCLSFYVREGECVQQTSWNDKPADVESIFKLEWVCFQSSCYYLPGVKQAINYTAAEDICASMGSHIVAIETQQEQDFIYSIIKSNSFHLVKGQNGYQRLYLGMDLNTLTWKHSNNQVDFTNGQDLTIKPNKCAIMNPWNGDWQNADCHRVYSFICEY